MSFEEMLETVVERAVRRALSEDRPRVTVLDELLTVAEAARLAKVSTDTVRQWLKDGLLDRYGAKHSVRVRREEVLNVRPKEDASEKTPQERVRDILAAKGAH